MDRFQFKVLTFCAMIVISALFAVLSPAALQHGIEVGMFGLTFCLGIAYAFGGAE